MTINTNELNERMTEREVAEPEKELETAQQAERIMKTFTSSLVHGDLGQWLDLFADEALFEFPYAPAEFTPSLEGKAALTEYIAAFPSLLQVHRFSEPLLHVTVNPHIFIAEFSCEAVAVPTGKPYHQRYISVIEHHDGKITHYKDYWNPLIALEALSGADTTAGSDTETTEEESK